MDIIAESLSVQQFDVNTKMTVNGLDVFDYIQSKLSTGVEFIGGYSDIDLAPKKNGYIAIVGTKEYIYSDSQSDWIQIGDETLYGQIVDYLNKAPEYALKTELSDYAKEDSLTAYVETDVLSGYALTSDLTSYAKKTDFDVLSDYAKSNVLTSYAQLSDLNQYQLSSEAGSMAYENKENYLTAVPKEYAKTTELSDIPSIKSDIEFLGSVSSDYHLTAAPGNMAYEDKGNYLTAVPAEYAKTTELSDIPTLNAKVAHLGTLSTDNILSAAAGSMAYEDKSSYLTAIPSGYAKTDDLSSFAKITELSDIPQMKADIQQLGSISSDYQLSAEAGSMAYEEQEKYVSKDDLMNFNCSLSSFESTIKTLSAFFKLIGVDEQNIHV